MIPPRSAVGCATTALLSLLVGCGGGGGEARDSGRDSGVIADLEVAAIADLDHSSDDGAAAQCLADRIGATPTDTSDATFSNQTQQACTSAPFCQAACADSGVQQLLDCAPVGFGFAWGFGAVYVIVHGRANGACVYDVGSEVEDSISWSRCSKAFPVAAWDGLRYVDEHTSKAPTPTAGLDDCVDLGSCTLESGAPNPCATGSDAPPTCPQALPPPC